MTRGRYGFAAVASLLAVIGSAAGADAQSCSEDPSYAILDFWVGDWDVLVDAEIVGKNRIEKILAGCALLEHWTDSEGGEGKSLFYRVPGEDSWKQAWVSTRRD